MIISTKERSYLLRKRREALLLLYDSEENEVRQSKLLDRIEELEDELEKITAEHWPELSK
jgi:hypothetical protein